MQKLCHFWATLYSVEYSLVSHHHLMGAAVKAMLHAKIYGPTNTD